MSCQFWAQQISCALALSSLSHASNLDWQSISHMIIYMFQCYSQIFSLQRSFKLSIVKESESSSVHLTLYNPRDRTCLDPLFMEFSRQEYWSGQLFLSPGDLHNSGIEPRFPTLQEYSLPSEPPGKPKVSICHIYSFIKLFLYSLWILYQFINPLLFCTNILLYFSLKFIILLFTFLYFIYMA